jgi:hypothetical protein
MKLPYQIKNEPKYMYDPVVSEQDVKACEPHKPEEQAVHCELPKAITNMRDKDIERKLTTRFDIPFNARVIERDGIKQIQIQELQSKMLFRIKPEEFRLSFTSPLDRLYTRVQDRLHNEKKDNGT